MTVPAKPPDVAADAREVRAFLAGDAEAFERLVDRHQRSVLGLCQRLTDAREAADLFQEIFLRAFRSLAQLREPAAFGGWLLRITVRLARRRRRALQRRPRPQLLTEEHTAERARDAIEVEEERAGIRAQLARLPERQREVVVLRHWHGLAFAEIARTLGIREDAARANHYQGLRRLRHALLEDAPRTTIRPRNNPS